MKASAPVADVGEADDAVYRATGFRPFAQRPECACLCSSDLAERIISRRGMDEGLFAQKRSGRKAGLAADEQRAGGPVDRHCQRIEVRLRIIAQPRHDEHMGIHVIVALATVRPAVTRTVASFRLAPGGPPPVVLLELRVLSVGQQPGRVFAISPCREYEPLL